MNPGPSIRSRLTLGAILAAGVVITAGSTAAYLITKRNFQRQIDTALTSRAQVIEGKSGVFFGRPVLWGKTGEFGQPPPPDQYEIYGSFHLTRDDGKVVASFSEIDGSPPIITGDVQVYDKPFNAELPDGTPVRAYATTYTVEGVRDERSRFRNRGRDRDRDKDDQRDDDRGDDRDRERNAPPERVTYPLNLIAIRDLTDPLASLSNLRLVLGSAGLATFLALALSINWIVSRTLAPVNKIASELEGRDATTLDTPLAEDVKVPSELSPLVGNFNTLLARINESLDRERRFASNAAHELRTPLAALSARLENATRQPRDSAAYIEAIEKSLANTRSMNTLVERLLSLARFDSDNFETELADTSLADVVSRSTGAFLTLAEQRKIDLDTAVPEGLALQTDPALLQVVVDNLVENAVSYADAGATVSVNATREGEVLSLEVSNTCTSLSEADTSHVFDPFWRGDAARTDAAVHAGLGLSICQKVTALLGGTISATSDAGTFTVRLELPAVSA